MAQQEVPEDPAIGMADYKPTAADQAAEDAKNKAVTADPTLCHACGHPQGEHQGICQQCLKLAKAGDDSVVVCGAYQGA